MRSVSGSWLVHDENNGSEKASAQCIARSFVHSRKGGVGTYKPMAFVKSKAWQVHETDDADIGCGEGDYCPLSFMSPLSSSIKGFTWSKATSFTTSS